MNPAKAKPQEYKFKFSTAWELQGSPSCLRILLTSFIVVASLFIPVIYALNHFNVTAIALPVYSWAIYIIVVNTVLLLAFSKYLSGSISYPYSNQIFSKSQRLNTNTKFSLEFLRCVERTSQMVQDVLATDKKEISGYDDQSTTDIESNTEEILPPKELYCKLASNCELIELYSGINNQLIEQGRASRNFRETTGTMLQIKECLKQIEVKVTF